MSGKVNLNQTSVIKIFALVVLIMLLVNISKRVYKGYKKYSEGNWILKGTKDAKKRMILLQDPSRMGSKTLGRSENEYSGLEFSYAFGCILMIGLINMDGNTFSKGNLFSGHSEHLVYGYILKRMQ